MLGLLPLTTVATLAMVAVRAPPPCMSSSSAASTLPPMGDALGTLRQACYLKTHPAKESVAAALGSVALSSSIESAELAQRLSARKWRAVFSAARPTKKTGLQIVDAGKWLPASSYTFTNSPVRTSDGSVADGSFETTISLLFGLFSIRLRGSYRLGVGARQTLSFERIRVGLFGGLLPILACALGDKAPAPLKWLLAKLRGGAPGRPNVLSWQYADSNLCVASGSSGPAALWGAA